jgi:photosystem II stability/assembly factor-like uncharacterized protein
MGTAAGEFLVSRDAGKTWLESQQVAPGAVTQFWLDPLRTDAVLAIAGNRLFRTINGGGFWDDVTRIAHDPVACGDGGFLRASDLCGD